MKIEEKTQAIHALSGLIESCASIITATNNIECSKAKVLNHLAMRIADQALLDVERKAKSL